MLLTPDELDSLANLKHRSPHQLLGMHPLGDGSGIVARALVPDAAKIELSPTHEKNKPSLVLQRITGTDVFEGISHKAKSVYAYDLTTDVWTAATSLPFEMFNALLTALSYTYSICKSA